MEKGDLKPITGQTLTFRNLYEDGRCVTMLNWPDGQWKVEIFGSTDAAMDWAKDNNFEVIIPEKWNAHYQRQKRK
jgi:hypothetical protein